MTLEMTVVTSHIISAYTVICSCGLRVGGFKHKWLAAGVTWSLESSDAGKYIYHTFFFVYPFCAWQAGQLCIDNRYRTDLEVPYGTRLRSLSWYRADQSTTANCSCTSPQLTRINSRGGDSPGQSSTVPVSPLVCLCPHSGIPQWKRWWK